MTVTAKRVALILVANAASMLGHKCISVVTSRRILYRHHPCRLLITISQKEGAAATDARRIVTVETVVSIPVKNAASMREHKMYQFCYQPDNDGGGGGGRRLLDEED